MKKILTLSFFTVCCFLTNCASDTEDVLGGEQSMQRIAGEEEESGKNDLQSSARWPCPQGQHLAIRFKKFVGSAHEPVTPNYAPCSIGMGDCAQGGGVLTVDCVPNVPNPPAPSASSTYNPVTDEAVGVIQQISTTMVRMFYPIQIVNSSSHVLSDFNYYGCGNDEYDYIRLKAGRYPRQTSSNGQFIYYDIPFTKL